MTTETRTLTQEEFIEDSKISYLEKNNGFITASKAKLIGKDFWAYWEKYENKNPNFTQKETKALGIGNAVDFFVSYGREAFESRYEILAPRKKRDITAEKIQFTNSDGKALEPIFTELERQPLFKLHNKKAIVQKELIGHYETPTNGKIKLKGTPDRIFYDEDWIDDTKTVSIKGNGKFENACKWNIIDYDYVFSMAFYAVLYYLDCGRFPKKLTLSFVGTNGGHKFLQYEIPIDLWQPEVEKIKSILEFYAENKGEAVKPNYSDMHQSDIFRHLKCEFYNLNHGAIQEKPIPYFNDNI